MVPVHAILIFTNMIVHYQYNGTYISKKHAECQIHVLVQKTMLNVMTSK